MQRFITMVSKHSACMLSLPPLPLPSFPLSLSALLRFPLASSSTSLHIASFTLLPPPSLSPLTAELEPVSLDPSEGGSDGKTLVTINGNNFVPSNMVCRYVTIIELLCVVCVGVEPFPLFHCFSIKFQPKIMYLFSLLL